MRVKLGEQIAGPTLLFPMAQFVVSCAPHAVQIGFISIYHVIYGPYFSIFPLRNLPTHPHIYCIQLHKYDKFRG